MEPILDVLRAGCVRWVVVRVKRRIRTVIGCLAERNRVRIHDDEISGTLKLEL